MDVQPGRGCTAGQGRVGVLLLVLVGPALLVATLAALHCFLERAKLTPLLSTVLVGIGSVLASFWVHFLPCLMLICDGGYEDYPSTRYFLQVITGPSVAAAASCWIWSRDHHPRISQAVEA